MSLDRKSLKLHVFVDIGQNANADKTSQLDILICLVDDLDNCHMMHWVLSKSKRITRTVLAGEVHAFYLGYDFGFSKSILFCNMNIDIPLYMFTDAMSTFNTITASKSLLELRLMSEIADIRRAYKTMK